MIAGAVPMRNYDMETKMSTVVEAPKKYVAYYRVSTKRQGESGLGLEAQQRDVNALAGRNNGPIIAEYIEVETGKMADRPKLHEAIHHAQLSNAILVVAKLDRLARNAAFTLALQKSGLPFVCCDNEHATPLTIAFLALIAQHEAEQIAARTKAALQSAKARGTLLGSNRPGFGTNPSGPRAASEDKPRVCRRHGPRGRKRHGSTTANSSCRKSSAAARRAKRCNRSSIGSMARASRPASGSGHFRWAPYTN